MRRLATAFVLVLLLSVMAWAVPHRAERSLFRLANHERTVRGIGTVVWAKNLHKVARAWSVHLATFHHLADPEKIYCDYQGANVGVSNTIGAMHNAWMDSSPHRANILNSNFHRLGVGTARDPDHDLWATEIFCG
jgi:uncharacterized protein YkwD